MVSPCWTSLPPPLEPMWPAPNNGGDHHVRPFTASWPFPAIISAVFAIMIILKIAFDVLWFRHLERTRSQARGDVEQGEPRNTSQQQRSLKTTLKEYGSSEERREEDVCAICLEDWKDGDCCRVLDKCNHVYHRECIDPWLSNNINCPLCRDSVPDRGDT